MRRSGLIETDCGGPIALQPAVVVKRVRTSGHDDWPGSPQAFAGTKRKLWPQPDRTAASLPERPIC